MHFAMEEMPLVQTQIQNQTMSQNVTKEPKYVVQINIFSEVLILASTNPQHDKRLSIELLVQYMKISSLEHEKLEENMFVCKNCFFVFVLTFRTIYVNNIF